MNDVQRIETGYEDNVDDSPDEMFSDSLLDDEETERKIKDAPRQTAFDALAALLAKPAKNEPYRANITRRPGLTLVFDATIDSERLEMWRKMSYEGRGKKRVFSQMRLSARIIANQCMKSEMNGEEVLTPEGGSVNFRGTAYQEMLGLPDGSELMEVIRALFGSDGQVINIATDILVAAGYGDEDEEENPTTLA